MSFCFPKDDSSIEKKSIVSFQGMQHSEQVTMPPCFRIQVILQNLSNLQQIAMEQNNCTEKLESNFRKTKQLSQREGYNFREKTVATADMLKDWLKID